MKTLFQRLTGRPSKLMALLESTEVLPPAHENAWIGVDLDGTLARFKSWKGLRHVGRPIPMMRMRIQRWLAAGYKVKIVTARASLPESHPPILKWLRKHKIGELEITNRVDMDMVELWDDRAVHVRRNTGQLTRSPSVMARPRAPLLEEAFPHENRPRLSFMDS
ncbi:hypothetical protein [Ruficoccus sp. ZRK36]|uniref:hypothetical protein n=1 Tax=Ruficoccus sp. ZRK36 TaxID=2866311 RepID=UPI001C72A66A|nr:hypothetical protein [Ruficoccus sp. ZRK36]QYY34683.1 hypothetical protein K0V07_10250 [Ruficoccus sp. ZRK36]